MINGDLSIWIIGEFPRPYVLMCDDQSLSSKHSITCFGDISLITAVIHESCSYHWWWTSLKVFGWGPEHWTMFVVPQSCTYRRTCARPQMRMRTFTNARALGSASFTVCLNVVVSGWPVKQMFINHWNLVLSPTRPKFQRLKDGRPKNIYPVPIQDAVTPWFTKS